MTILLKKIIFFCYNQISTFYENYFLKKTKLDNQNELTEKGYAKIIFLNQLNINKYIEKKIKGPNLYLNKFIINKNMIRELLLNIFIKNKVAENIFKLTGFSYSVDFFVAYETSHIPEQFEKMEIYANHWHRDKPFSKNTLKLIIPIDEISAQHGGIEILDKYSSLNLNKKYSKNNSYYKMISPKNEGLLFLPNVCFHRAGNPAKNLLRSQLMFQLNPSKKWSYKTNLFELQFFQEPKFPIKNLLSTRLELL